jgi:glycosyltransferase involved in cell wall biosynthesis
MGNTNADKYLARQTEWTKHMQEFLKLYTTTDVFSVDNTAIPEDQLPGVTIVTPTRDRQKFMEICAGAVDSQCYPKDKLEWIVIDDGKDTCEEFIKHIPYARYVLEMAGKTIAWKRNLGARLAKFPVIIHMDDDDIYPPNSILFRVSMMLRAKKECAFCTVLPSYDIANYISFVNIPPIRLPQSMRVSEATMCYTKTFWEEKGFPEDIKIAEGDLFIKGREKQCIELSPQEIIVSLVHPRTTSSRRVPPGTEPNGCHYGFTDDLFKMLSTLGEYLKRS